MKMDNFVNLHCHSMYSIQDSVIKTDELCKLVGLYRQTSCAITDHSSTAGWYDFSKDAKKNSIKPIYGNEFYCIKSYNNKTRNRDHLVMLAKNNNGLITINQLQRIAVENSYYKPLLSLEELFKEECIENIIATSACSLGTISKYILDGNLSEAECYAEKFATLFNDDFYLELQFHPQYKEQAIINNEIVKIADNFGLDLIVTCDSHFLNEDNKEVRKVIQAIAWNKDFDEIADSLSSNCVGNTDIILDNAYKSGFDDLDLVKKAINNTQKISEKCNANFEEYNRLIPSSNDKIEELERLFESVRW